MGTPERSTLADPNKRSTRRVNRRVRTLVCARTDAPRKSVHTLLRQSVPQAGRPKGVLQTQVADNDVTTPHGGQDWRQCSNYVEDFSVTTNGLGTPASGITQAARPFSRCELGSYLSHNPWSQAKSKSGLLLPLNPSPSLLSAALAAAREAVSDLSHYPPANFEPHLSHLAGFLWGDAAAAHSDCLQLGNGASELVTSRACRKKSQKAFWHSCTHDSI